jgi:hypothetical protein
VSGDKPEELVSVPADLTLLSDQDLNSFESKVVTEFERVNSEDVTPERITYAMQLADDLDRVRAEVSARQVRAQNLAESQRAKLLESQAALRTRVHGSRPGDEGGEGGGVRTATQVADTEAIAAAAAKGAMSGLLALLGDQAIGRDITRVTQRATASLADAKRFAPHDGSTIQPKRLAITASVDIPGVARGDGVSNLDALVDIVQRKARSMQVTQNQPNYALTASIKNEYEHTVDDRTSVGQVEELVNFLTSKDKQEALVAAGGWCAPSEIRYDFFNVACSDGLVDLPTFGVSRGGIRFPTSPSLADVFEGAFGGFSTALSVTSNPWIWTEASDIAAVTGSPTKPCIRVPCPDFDEERLECFGICLTAGNLTDDAYPEATRNFLRLLLTAHDRAMNGRFISRMVSLSSAAINTGSYAVTGQPVYQQVYGGISLAVTDYRARYGMCEDDVLEVVAPYWLKSEIRADIAWRNGADPQQIPDSEINRHFTALNVRVQWVNDWQVRGAGQFGNATAMTAWPTSATVLVYAAGTFVKGSGLSLDLGVVRDSVLNATNDHTAAWSEECHLIARVGHESRQYTINFAVNGRTGSANGTGNNL